MASTTTTSFFSTRPQLSPPNTNKDKRVWYTFHTVSIQYHPLNHNHHNQYTMYTPNHSLICFVWRWNVSSSPNQISNYHTNTQDVKVNPPSSSIIYSSPQRGVANKHPVREACSIGSANGTLNQHANDEQCKEDKNNDEPSKQDRRQGDSLGRVGSTPCAPRW